MTIQILAIIALLAAGIHFWWLNKKKNQKLAAMIANQIQSNEHVKKTLAMGLYYRFHKMNVDQDGKEESVSKSFVRQDPIQLEHFVADVLQKRYGGNIFVSQASGDYGVDIEHVRSEGTYYGQVKCYKNDLDYQPIALVHSNMTKYNVVWGFVVTTSDFTENARKYAQGLNIDLINGVSLVDLWMERLELQTNEVRALVTE